MRLSDSIESFIKMLMEEGEPQVELKRNELAEYSAARRARSTMCWPPGSRHSRAT